MWGVRQNYIICINVVVFISSMKSVKNLFPLFIAALAFFACKENTDSKAMAKVSEETNSVEVAQEDVTAHAKLKAKTRKVVGDADYSRNAGVDWKRLRVGQKVVENDQIKTGEESQAILAMDDGSSLWITENSCVTVTYEILDSMMNKVSVEIKNGQVRFDVQKQKPSVFMEFRTGTAVAAIRGTAGFVGEVNGKMVASLKEGRVEVISKNGKTTTLLKNQTVVVDEKQGIVKMDLQASGSTALSKVLDSLTRMAPEADVARELTVVLKKFDTGYKDRLAKFEKNLKFQASALPTEVYLPNVTLQARTTPGMIVTVGGETDTVGANGIYQHTFEWAEDAYGTKRFLASCSDGDVEIPCFMWTTEYVAPPAEVPAAEEPVVDTVAAAKPKAETPAKVEEPAKDLKISVKLSGPRTERVHNKSENYTARIKGSLTGISDSDMDQVKSIVLKRKGQVEETLQGGSLSSTEFEFEQQIERNRIANFEVAVTLKNGKGFTAKKTYEVYCNPRNHANGEDVVPVDEEYENLKAKGTLKEE